MQRIGSHISELLFNHDCVIVPSLGGFLASNENARLLPNRILYPPYRRIAFNVYLKQNDGLLANHLVETEGISYSTANSLVEEFTFECIHNLEQGKKVNIEEVGTLYFDHEKNIQFEAYRNINHRKDSFGMEPVQIIPVHREVKEERRKPEQKITRQIPTVKPTKRPVINQRSKRFIGIAAVVALIGFSANLYLTAPKKYESTSLIPFDSQLFVGEETLKEPATVLQETEVQLPSTDTQNSQMDSTLVAEIVPSIPSPVVSVTETAPPERELPVVISPEPSTLIGPKHHIVAGVFKIRENALTLLARLQSAGFKNARLIEANNRNYVSYDAFVTPADAVAMADSLRRNNMEGWIWKH